MRKFALLVAALLFVATGCDRSTTVRTEDTVPGAVVTPGGVSNRSSSRVVATERDSRGRVNRTTEYNFYNDK